MLTLDEALMEILALRDTDREGETLGVADGVNDVEGETVEDAVKDGDGVLDRVSVALPLEERVSLGEGETELDTDRVDEEEAELEGERDAEDVTEGETDTLALSEAVADGVAVVPGAMQQAGRTYEQRASTKPPDVDCTQLLLPLAFLGNRVDH